MDYYSIQVSGFVWAITVYMKVGLCGLLQYTGKCVCVDYYSIHESRFMWAITVYIKVGLCGLLQYTGK